MTDTPDPTLGYDAAWFVDVLDAMSEFVLVKGKGSRLLWANRAFRDYYGMSNADLAGLVDAPEVAPDLTLKYVRDDLEVFTSQRPLVVDEPITRHDGHTAHYRTEKTAIVEDGTTTRTVGVSRPMVDAQEIAVVESSRAARADGLGATAQVLDTLPITAALVDVHGRIVAMSQMFRETFESSEDLVGRGFGEVFAIENRLREVVTSDRALDCGVFGLDDRLYDVKLRPWKPLGDEIAGAFVVCEDRTAVAEAQQVAVAHAVELESVVDALGTAVAAVDGEGNFVLYNNEAARLTGGRPANRAEFFADNHALCDAEGEPLSPLETPLGKALEGKTTFNRLLRVRHKSNDRDDAWVNLSAAPLTVGRLTAVVSFQDVTMLIKTQRELEQFAYVASHDLQEPLRMVRSYVELLEDELDGDLDPVVKDYMHYIKDGAVRMSALVRDLLNYSRSGAQVLEVERIDLEDLIDEIEQDLAIAITESNAVIKREGLIEVLADRAQLKQEPSIARWPLQRHLSF